MLVQILLKHSGVSSKSQEFSGDDSLFAKIDNVIDEELEKLGIHLKEKIRK